MLQGHWGSTCLDQELPLGIAFHLTVPIMVTEANTECQFLHVYWECDTDGRPFTNSYRGVFKSSAAANSYVATIPKKARRLPLNGEEVSVHFFCNKTQLSDTH